MAAPRNNPGTPFEVTVTFDMNVTGFATNDLLVSGGSVTSLRDNPTRFGRVKVVLEP